MDTSQQMLLQLPEELRDEYQEREQARGPYDKAVEEAVKSGEEPPAPEEGIDVRSMEELQTELEKQEANLEMNVNTNPGVVEQYEKRKRDVRVLSLYPSFDGYH
jgi:chromosome segregation ATPase